MTSIQAVVDSPLSLVTGQVWGMNPPVDVLVRVLQGNRANYIYLSIYISYEELAHVIIKAEKSHNLLSVS